MTYQPLRKRRFAVRTWAEQARWKLFQPSEKLGEKLQESQREPSPPQDSPVSDSPASKSPVSELASPELAHLVGSLRDRDWTTAKVALFLLALPWGGATVAYHWLAAVPDAPNCQSPSWSQAEFERLQCLTTDMQSGDMQQLISGIRKLRAWPEQSPLHAVAQQLLEDWSLVVWSQAQVEYEAGEWENSARLIAEIPEDFEVWSQAQARSSLWQKVQAQGDKLYQRAEAAIKDQDWQKALNHAKELAALDNDYWRRQGLHELPALIEEHQAAATEGRESVARLSDEPKTPPSAPLPSGSWVSDPRSARPRKIHSAPIVVSLTRPKVDQPGQRPPEFSVA